MASRKPVIHASDHLPGHSDPIPGLTIGGSGIQFDTDPQSGGFLVVDTSGAIDITAGSGLNLTAVGLAQLTGDDVNVNATDDATVNCHDFRVVATGGNFNIQSDTTSFIQAGGVGATLHLFGQAGVIVNSDTGQRALDVRDDTGATSIFVINEDGTVHGVTGGSIVWDL